MTRELTQRSFQLTHDDLKARKGEDSCSHPASVEIRTRSPAPGFTWSCRHSALCDWCGGGRWAQDADPCSCPFCTPTGLPLLFTGMWVGCKLAFEDVA